MENTQIIEQGQTEDTAFGLERPAQYLTFKIAGETYALGILRVKEILRYETLTQVPATPRSICGVMNLRGNVVPVVDLAVKFNLPSTRVTKWTCVVIVEAELDGKQTVMGVMADSVSEVLDLRSGDIEPPPPFGTKVHVEYLLGMGKTEKKFILILDIDKVLTVDEIAAAQVEQIPSEAVQSVQPEDTPKPAESITPPPAEASEDSTVQASEDEEEDTANAESDDESSPSEEDA